MRFTSPLSSRHRSVVVAVAPAGVVRALNVGLYASRQPSTGKVAEGWADTNQEERVVARIQQELGQLAGEARVTGCAERHWRRVEDALRPIDVVAAGIAHDRADDLIDRTGRAAGISAYQYEPSDRELDDAGPQIDASRPRSRDPRQRAAVNLSEDVLVVVGDDPDRVVDIGRGDDADDVPPADHRIVVVGGGEQVSTAQHRHRERTRFLHDMSFHCNGCG